jgi:hypothetical protein
MGRPKANKELAAPTKSEFVSVRLGVELKRQLEDRADREGRSLSNLIRQIIRTDMTEATRAFLLARILSGDKSPAELENLAQKAQESK